MICKHCQRAYTKKMIEAKRKQKSDRIKEARRIAKLNGEPVGAKKIRDDNLIKSLRAQGLSIRAISKHIGMSTTPVVQALKGEL